MKKGSLICAAVAVLASAASPVSAQVTTFGATTPTGNYAAFLAALAGYGAAASTITFEGQPNGTLNPTFTPGVTFTSAGDVTAILNGAGPGQTNTSGSSIGEGQHAPSNYLFDGGNPSSLTISFANPVFGAGLFIIDYFNPGGDNQLTFQAFIGQNGTGTSLGVFTSPAMNAQSNNMYFMGITSAAGDIGSVVFTDVNAATGDETGIDDITIGAAAVTATPEPASVLLMATGLAGFAMFRRKRAK